MKRLFPSIFGNTAERERLGRDILTGSASHAYIISGPDGSGRSLLARQICAAVLCGNVSDESEPLPCGHCSACDRIMRGIHPDVITFGKGDRRTIGVDTVRRIKHDILIAPDEAEHKFFIIEDAETMTAEAQNALLISLEEPPPFVTFILIATDHTLLLETIRSRAQLVRTQALDSAEMHDFLEARGLSSGLSDERIADITRETEGIPGRALELVSGADSGAKTHAAAEEFLKVTLTGDAVSRARLAAEITRSREELAAIIAECKVAVRDIIAQKKRAGASPLFFDSAQSVRAYTSQNLVSLCKFYNLLERSERELSGNSSALLIAERIIMHKI